MNKPKGFISPIIYLRDRVGIDGDFLSEWRKLTQKDKDELKQYAIEEIKGKGNEKE
tara:strand:+ start:145 stop:312 length:168 start_codon:yes stop_codon:yes gene_type:complete